MKINGYQAIQQVVLSEERSTSESDAPEVKTITTLQDDKVSIDGEQSRNFATINAGGNPPSSNVSAIYLAESGGNGDGGLPPPPSDAGNLETLDAGGNGGGNLLSPSSSNDSDMTLGTGGNGHGNLPPPPN